MEKRVLLAVFLSFVVLFLYQSFVAPPPSTPPATAARRPAPETRGQAASPSASATAVEASAPAAGPAPVVSETAARDIVVETDAVRAVFTNRGAEIKSWTLKRYHDSRGRAVELVPSLPNQPRPFALRIGDGAVDQRIRAALFKSSTVEPGGNQPRKLIFEYRDAEIAVRKEFAIGPAGQPYVIRFSALVERNGQAVNPTVLWGPGLADALVEAASSYSQRPQAILSLDGDTDRIAPDDLAKQSTYLGPYDFAGVDDQYFLAAAVSRQQPVQIAYEVVPAPGPAPAAPLPLVGFSIRFPAAPTNAIFFFGPKDFDVLKSVDAELVRAIHFGMMSFIVVPLLTSLKWINTYIQNYGWSIVILTVIINALMFPLRHKSVVSMRKMEALKPEVQAIQDRYSKLKATDPAKQKMQTEIMNLYRERGVNPASGCVPMLLTMPVLIAFYSLLSVAIEIRGAPFVLWLKDLSIHDPLYITPLLMGGTMFWQQMITPMAGDAMQQRMMMFIMPVMFTVMLLWAPSGLVLYWLVSNLWTIGQQYMTNRIIGRPVVRTARPAAERRVKRGATNKSSE